MKTKISDAEIQRPVKLSCRNLWKVFGPNAAKFMQERDGKATTAELDKAGLVGAVRNTTLDVREGEIFIVMGLSGSGKSTLVRCLALSLADALDRQRKGHILQDGEMGQQGKVLEYHAHFVPPDIDEFSFAGLQQVLAIESQLACGGFDQA